MPTASDGEPLRISWSRVRMHDECPAKGDLMRRHKPSAQDVRSYFHGNVVDLAMRRWLSQDEPEPGWMAAHVDALFDESVQIARETDNGFVKWKHPGDQRELREFCLECVTRLEKILARYCLPFTWQPAVRFSAPVMITDLAGEMRLVNLVGEMDLMVQDAREQVAVWDLKATRDNGYYRKVLGQLAFYALAVRAMSGKFPAVTGLFQPMCDQQVLPVTVDDAAVRQMAARIEKTARDIWAGLLAPKADDAGCDWCAVKFACPKFKMLSRPGRAAFV